ncbi:LysR family transcriptional regulator [Enterobacter genomosp. O]|uniref:LysR family transcriptional regulator n=1 Tax=Enterobacter genomosp. O TaxID=2364150 RepID=UPI001F616E3F|nr:LysR family transcriptional regulator [Enterobacter genomosp. O]
MSSRLSTTLTRSDLAELNAFLITEKRRSFTKAAIELGITTSALSHTIRNLETRLRKLTACAIGPLESSGLMC